MLYFDKAPSRRGSSCMKWDLVPSDVIPMWIADMDFETAPCIKEAVLKRAHHGVFGYTAVPASYYESICRWYGTRHGWQIDPSWIIPTTGVVPALSACLSAFTSPGDKVLMLTPIYNCFYSSIRNWGCQALEVPLATVTKEGRPYYTIDFDALEKAADDDAVKIMLICSPHNPAGRVWTREELRRMGEICLSRGIIPVVDEIHCEFTFPGYKFVPFASIDPEFEKSSVILSSCTKAFNIAGLQIANVICRNEALRARVDKAININEICDVNPFGVVALEAAYSPEGARWLDDLNIYFKNAYLKLDSLIQDRVPQILLYRMEGTYLAWMDVRTLCRREDGSLKMSSAELVDNIEEHERVRVNSGHIYGSEGFVRVNLATVPDILDEGLERLVRGFERLR